MSSRLGKIPSPGRAITSLKTPTTCRLGEKSRSNHPELLVTSPKRDRVSLKPNPGRLSERETVGRNTQSLAIVPSRKQPHLTQKPDRYYTTHFNSTIHILVYILFHHENNHTLPKNPIDTIPRILTQPFTY